MPGYLKKGWGESRWQTIVKFRLGDGIKEGKYWEEEEGRKCRICGCQCRRGNIYGKNV